MTLSLPTENRLRDAGLIQYFEKHKEEWTNASRRTYKFVREGFPSDAVVRADDVSKELAPLVEVNEELRTYRKTQGLKQQFWTALFADLVVERTWQEIAKSD